ncbi:MAG: PepSY domain-containing protein [Rhodanobacteraceae bacterium]
MQFRFATIVPALVLCAAAVAAPPSRSQNGHQQMSLEGAVQHVQRQTNGRILAADSIPNGRNKLYRIKVLTPDGHVRVMQLHSNDTPSNQKSSSRERKRDDSGGH